MACQQYPDRALGEARACNIAAPCACAQPGPRERGERVVAGQDRNAFAFARGSNRVIKLRQADRTFRPVDPALPTTRGIERENADLPHFQRTRQVSEILRVPCEGLCQPVASVQEGGIMVSGHDDGRQFQGIYPLPGFVKFMLGAALGEITADNEEMACQLADGAPCGFEQGVTGGADMDVCEVDYPHADGLALTTRADFGMILNSQTGGSSYGSPSIVAGIGSP